MALVVVLFFAALTPQLLLGCAGPSKQSVASKRDSGRVLSSNSNPTATPASSTKKKSIVSGRSTGKSKKSTKEHQTSSKNLQTASKVSSVSKKTESVSKKGNPAPSKEGEAMSQRKKKEARGSPSVHFEVEKTQDSEKAESEREATLRDPTKEDTKSLIFDKNQPISEDHDHGI